MGQVTSGFWRALRHDNESERIKKDDFGDFSAMSSDMFRAVASAVNIEATGGRLCRRRPKGGAKAAAPTAESDFEPSVKICWKSGYLSVRFLKDV